MSEDLLRSRVLLRSLVAILQSDGADLSRLHCVFTFLQQAQCRLKVRCVPQQPLTGAQGK